MERTLYKGLLDWKKQDNRKPLLLQGARQVGKTYLLKEFARREYQDCAYFNFEKTPELGSLFESSLSPSVLIEALAAYIGRKIEPGSTLIFFDEIQVFPRAITSLKYFYEEAPEYHVVAAGSLLGVSVGKTTSFPVGKVNFMTLYPMSFFEYLTAVDNNMMVKMLMEKETPEALLEPFHEKLTRHLKYYLYIGGMPEVVQHYIDHQDIGAVRRTQKDILEAFERDFSKYSSPTEAIKISEIWSSIPLQLARENKKFKYGDVKKGARASRFDSAIEWLRKAGLIHIIYNLKAPKMPPAGYIDRNRFKIYMLDPGLLGAVLDLSSQAIILGDQLFSEYNGAFTENYVAGELTAGLGTGNIFYWTSNSQAEVDFVIYRNGEFLPIEVKSGLSRRTKSLRIYSEKYRSEWLWRISPRNFTHDDDLINIPLYAVQTILSLHNS